jgi:hypothetical protein
VARRRSAIAAFVFTLASIGCGGGGRYDLDVTFAAGVDPVDARFIEVILVDTCPDPTSLASGVAPTSSDLNSSASQFMIT